MAESQTNAFRGGQFDHVASVGDEPSSVPTATDRRLAVALRNLRWVRRVTWFASSRAIQVRPARNTVIDRLRLRDVRDVVEEYGTDTHEYAFDNDEIESGRVFIQNTARQDNRV